MQIKNILWISSLVSTVLFSTTPAWAKEYYKWVDRNGSTHYTTTPPPKQAIKKGKINTYGWQNNTAAPNAPAQAANENKADVATTTPADEKVISETRALTSQSAVPASPVTKKSE